MRQIQGSIPACAVRVFPGRVIPESIPRVPHQNGVSQAGYIAEIHHSGRNPRINFVRISRPPRDDFSVLSDASDLQIGTPVATLPGAWRYRVSAGSGRPGASILCNFYLNVPAHTLV